MADKYGTGGDRQYCYPDSEVLINKLGITDEASLADAEIELTESRISKFEPDFSNISLSALRNIHFFLFQDLYDWAGELRTVDISKGTTRFANVSRIEPEADKLFRQLAKDQHLTNLPRARFVAKLAYYYSELNVIHPFRDGNGRAQRLLFEIISINAGYTIRWEPITRADWVDANIAAFHCRLEPMIALMTRAVDSIPD